MTRALKIEITIKAGRVEQNFNTYLILRVIEAPVTEVTLCGPRYWSPRVV